MSAPPAGPRKRQITRDALASDDCRFKLIPTQGRKRAARFVYGHEAASQGAQEWFDETGIPVMVVAHPPGGLVRAVATVGGSQKRMKR